MGLILPGGNNGNVSKVEQISLQEWVQRASKQLDQLRVANNNLANEVVKLRSDVENLKESVASLDEIVDGTDQM